ncbi:hypothetical protein [Neobacillus terrae]|uniref:hypothetical protein n=1 Tax=Neobacillus terrae TaxID=3034837 RepID=UPI001407DCE0|nr:hypothetical protein [Neobacillus terrae]NHM29357.1 hypothetical protein [Neobacillus terrae]
MKIYEYYRDSANLTLNGGLLALFPAMFIVLGNILILHQKILMLLCIPFIVYSVLSYQLYRNKTRDGKSIKKNMLSKGTSYPHLFCSQHLLVLFLPAITPSVKLFYPDGNLAGEISPISRKLSDFMNSTRRYILTDQNSSVRGSYRVKNNNSLVIEVWNEMGEYAGKYQKRKRPGFKKVKKELFEGNGCFLAEIKGAAFFMDEQIIMPDNESIGRLRRGWMPVEWSSIFPDSNTPVLTLNPNKNSNINLLAISVLINEFFIER